MKKKMLKEDIQKVRKASPEREEMSDGSTGRMKGPMDGMKKTMSSGGAKAMKKEMGSKKMAMKSKKK